MHKGKLLYMVTERCCIIENKNISFFIIMKDFFILDIMGNTYKSILKLPNAQIYNLHNFCKKIILKGNNKIRISRARFRIEASYTQTQFFCNCSRKENTSYLGYMPLISYFLS